MTETYLMSRIYVHGMGGDVRVGHDSFMSEMCVEMYVWNRTHSYV